MNNLNTWKVLLLFNTFTLNAASKEQLDLYKPEE